MVEKPITGALTPYRWHVLNGIYLGQIVHSFLIIQDTSDKEYEIKILSGISVTFFCSDR